VIVQAVVLAAGRGKRLQPLTLTRTKAMLPVLGRPMVARVVETLLPAGVDGLVIVASPDDDEIVPYFGDRCPLNLPVQFAFQEQRLGMAHALVQAAPLIRGAFLLSACDSLTSPAHVADLAARFWSQAAGGAALSVLTLPPEEIPSAGIVAIENGRVTRIVEKPRLEDAPSDVGSMPLYVFSERLLALLPEVKPSPRGEYELQDAIQALIDEGAPVVPVPAPWRLTVTRPEDLLTLNRVYLETGEQRLPAPAAVAPGAQVMPPVYVEDGATIGADAVVGPRVYLECGAAVGAGARVVDSIVLRGAHVPAAALVEFQVVA
jgi:glucose-1-phosphate thymidylyltransferase